MIATTPSLGLRLALAWIALWEPLAPASHRTTWRDQWRADLWHYAAWLAREHRSHLALRLFARASAAPLHAFLLRVQSWSLHMLMHDLRFAWRMIVRRPAFSAVAIGILGLGIGANATIFSWVDTTLLSPMPGVADQGRLVSLRGTSANRPDLSISYLNFVDIRAARPAGIEDLFAFRALPLSLRAAGEPIRVWGQLTSASLFDVLRVPAIAGRTLMADDDAVIGKSPVAVISHALWQRQFHGDPAVVGRAVTLNGEPFTIVGVAAEGFRGSMTGLALDVFVPITMQRAVLGGTRLPERGNAFLQVFGRLTPGSSTAEAQASLDVVSARLASAYPTFNTGRGVKVLPLWRDGASGLMLPVMALLTAVVGVVLLIACANLAGLLLARAAGRQREIAVRLAVGASRGRLIRQFLVETALLAIGGGAAGLLLSYWTADLLNGFLPAAPVPIGFTAAVGPAVLVFWLCTTVFAAALVGLVPAIRASRPDITSALQTAAASTSQRRGWLRQALVVSQVALSLLLVACAALFTRSLQEAHTIDPGFALRQGLVASLELPVNAYDAARGNTFYQELQRRLATVPGVTSASVSTTLPLGLGTNSNMSVEIDGYPAKPGEEIGASYARVGDRYFETMGIPIVKGRAIDQRDVAGRERVVVINETMAARYFEGREPIGAILKYGAGPARVVGVARDGKYLQLSEEARNYLYVPLTQFYRPEVALVVAADGDPLPIVSAVRAEVRRLDPNLPLFDVRTVDEYRQFSRFLPRMASILLSGFGVLALLLAAVGLYSVIAFTVSQRTHEIGLRMALGADRSSVVTMILKQGLVIVGMGVVFGLLLSAGAARLIGGQLIGVRPSDPVSWALTIGVLGVVAAMACAFPALHAASLDPLRALRHD